MQIYIWKAEQSEPGMTGCQYKATTENQAPKEIDPVPVAGADGLAYQESFYDHWTLIGACECDEITENAYGDQIIVRPNAKTGDQPLGELVRLGWYTQAK